MMNRKGAVWLWNEIMVNASPILARWAYAMGLFPEREYIEHQIFTTLTLKQRGKDYEDSDRQQFEAMNIAAAFLRKWADALEGLTE